MANLSVRERRLIALALLVAVVASLWYGLVNPLLDGFAARAAEREQLSDDRARQLRLLGSVGVWRARAKRQQSTLDAFALRAPSAGAAADAAKQRLLAVVAAEGGTVKTLREEPGPAGMVRLRAELQLTLTQLSASLRVIENQKPYVVIEKLSITADQAVVSGRLSPMDVSIDLALPYVVAPA
jgi:general secretion pathway protein M